MACDVLLLQAMALFANTSYHIWNPFIGDLMQQCTHKIEKETVSDYQVVLVALPPFGQCECLPGLARQAVQFSLSSCNGCSVEIEDSRGKC